MMASVPVMPTVRSRLWAASTAFVLGFVIANVGILLVSGADRWAWLAVAVLLMITGAVGVLVADTRRRLSLWALIAFELFVVATAAPLVWVVSVAVTPAGVLPSSLVPGESSWAAFGEVFEEGVVRDAAVTTIVAATAATVVSMVLAVPAAYALARRRVWGRPVVWTAVVATLLLPVVVVAVPWFETYERWNLLGQRWGVVPLLLVVALPLACWLCVIALRLAPWSLRDSIRTDGASRWQQMRFFGVPMVAPDLLVVAAVVWVVTAQDVVLGSALGVTQDSRPLPATLLYLGEDATSVSAAVALMWLLPTLALAVIAPRRLSRLIGRDDR